ARCARQVNFIDVAGLTVARIPVSDARTIRREHRLAFTLAAPGQWADCATGHVEQLDRTEARVTVMRRRPFDERNGFAIRRPRKRRRWRPGRQRDGQTPLA